MAAEKKSRKVIDAVHPGDTPPTPTSRPIVGNRSYIASDPMLNESTSDDSSDKPSGEPSTATKEAAAKEPPVSREAKDIVPMEEASKNSADATKNAEEKAAEPETDAKSDVVADAKDESNDTTKEQASSANSEKPDTDTTEKSNESQAVDTVAISDNETGDSGDTPTPTPEDEANAAREAELERHIAAGTYAVPIGQVKQRQRKMMVIITVVLVFAAVVFDVLLDLEILKLSGVPHTNFL